MSRRGFRSRDKRDLHHGLLRDPPTILPVSVERGFRDAEARRSFWGTAESLQSVHDEALSEGADRLAVADGVVLQVDLGIHVARAAENLRMILPQVWNIDPLAGRHVGYQRRAGVGELAD